MDTRYSANVCDCIGLSHPRHLSKFCGQASGDPNPLTSTKSEHITPAQVTTQYSIVAENHGWHKEAMVPSFPKMQLTKCHSLKHSCDPDVFQIYEKRFCRELEFTHSADSVNSGQWRPIALHCPEEIANRDTLQWHSNLL